MIEQKEKYNEKLIVSKGNGPILKDIAPLNSKEHWYITPIKEYDIVMQAKLMQLSNNVITEVIIDFQRDDIIQIIDTANYGLEHIAIFYETRVQGTEDIKEFIAVYDMKGNAVEVKEMTAVSRGDGGHFRSLEYIE